MSAFDAGMKSGKDYLRKHSVEDLEKITIDEFCKAGFIEATHKYKQRKAITEYEHGRLAIVKQFPTLFKPDEEEQTVADAEIEYVDRTLIKCFESLRKLETWRSDDPEINTRIVQAIRFTAAARDLVLETQKYLNEIRWDGQGPPLTIVKDGYHD